MKKKIIPCLDMKNGNVVKGVHFDTLKKVGDPCTLALEYQEQGADEIVFLDISATLENRKTTLDVIASIAPKLTVPFVVGGGISELEDMEKIFGIGASKVSLNTAAFKNPQIIEKASKKYGKEKIVVAIDVKKFNDEWHVVVEGGKTDTKVRVQDWVKTCEQLGAGELLVTSMDTDGVKQGYDVELYQVLKHTVDLPIIASGGCGSLDDFYEVFEKADVDAALAASLFHYGIVNVQQVKEFVRQKGIEI